MQKKFGKHLFIFWLWQISRKEKEGAKFTRAEGGSHVIGAMKI